MVLSRSIIWSNTREEDQRALEAGMTNADFLLLAEFFMNEFNNDSTGVGEWLDVEGNFNDEDERDEWIEEVKAFIRRGK